MNQTIKAISHQQPIGDLAFILGTMRQGYNVEPNQLGFIPVGGVQEHYVTPGNYAIQKNRNGVQVGYVLHGRPVAGRLLIITQAIIDIDRRNLSFGEEMITTLIERARNANCRGIRLRCAADLEANGFWQQMGFVMTKSEFPGNKRQRAINTYLLDLWPTLWNKER